MKPARKPFTKAQRLEVFERFGAVVCCQAPNCDNAIYIKGAQIDHWLALVDGGQHEIENWRPICTSCHRKKSAREHIGNRKAVRISKGGRKRRGRAIPSRPFGKQKRTLGRRK